MAEPFLAEVRIMSFNFAPRGWALCNGQLLPINLNQALFALLGTTYGGNGQTTFALPDLRGRTPLHVGGGLTLGQNGGAQNHTLTINEIPTHVHQVAASTATSGSVANPTARFPGRASVNAYGPAAALQPMNPGVVGNVGGSQAHQNMQPYMTLSFCIALQGIFPSPN